MYVFLLRSKFEQVVYIWEVPISNICQISDFPKVLPRFIQQFQASSIKDGALK